MSDGANYFKQIESEEIKKNITFDNSINEKHLEVIEYVDSLEKPRIGFWKKKK